MVREFGLVKLPNAAELDTVLLVVLLGGSALKNASIITSSITGNSFTASRLYNIKGWEHNILYCCVRLAEVRRS